MNHAAHPPRRPHSTVTAPALALASLAACAAAFAGEGDGGAPPLPPPHPFPVALAAGELLPPLEPDAAGWPAHGLYDGHAARQGWIALVREERQWVLRLRPDGQPRQLAYRAFFDAPAAQRLSLTFRYRFTSGGDARIAVEGEGCGALPFLFLPAPGGGDGWRDGELVWDETAGGRRDLAVTFQGTAGSLDLAAPRLRAAGPARLADTPRPADLATRLRWDKAHGYPPPPPAGAYLPQGDFRTLVADGAPDGWTVDGDRAEPGRFARVYADADGAAADTFTFLRVANPGPGRVTVAARFHAPPGRKLGLAGELRLSPYDHAAPRGGATHRLRRLREGAPPETLLEASYRRATPEWETFGRLVDTGDGGWLEWEWTLAEAWGFLDLRRLRVTETENQESF